MVTSPKVFPLTPQVFRAFHLEGNVFGRRETYTDLSAFSLGDSPGSNCIHNNYMDLNSFCWVFAANHHVGFLDLSFKS